nr:ATP-dependent Clp protease ATP-binding subunit [Clostridia bacterium]
MEMCARCHKRPAVVFITKIENGKSTNQGICIKCAKELGIRQVNEIMERMGITDEDLDRMDNEMESLMSAMEGGEGTELAPSEGGEDSDDKDSRAPAVDFRKLFGGFMPINPMAQAQNPGQQGQAQNAQPKQKGLNKRKYLDQYCLNLTKRAADGKLDRIVGRDRELERVMQILCRRQKNNPCLIG